MLRAQRRAGESGAAGDESGGDRRPASLVRAAVSTFGTNAAAVGCALLNVLVIARALGPSGRGEVAFIIVVYVLVVGLASCGIEEANANIGATRGERRGTLLTNSIIAATGLGAVAALLVAALMVAVPGARGGAHLSLLLVVLATLPIGLLQEYLKFLLQSDYRFGSTNAAWVSSPAASLVVNGAFAVAGALTVTTVIVVYVATNALAMLILLIAAARHFGFARPDPGLARETISFGLKVHVSKLMGLGIYRADQWLIGIIAGPYELGLYSIAASLMEVLFYIAGVIVLVQRPRLVRATAADAAEFAARIFRRAVLLSSAAALALFVSAPLLIVTLFGERFRGSVDDLRWLTFAALGVLAVDLFTNAIIAQRRPLLASAGVAVALALTIVLDLLLVPAYGGEGAAIAKSVAYTAGGAVLGATFLRMFHGSPRSLVPRSDDVAWYWRTALAALRRGS